MHLGLPCKPGSPSFPNGTTNGAGWYPLTGGAQDYSYVWAGTMEVTIEMSCCKYPPAAELPVHWNEHRQVCKHWYQLDIAFRTMSVVSFIRSLWSASWARRSEECVASWRTCLVVRWRTSLWRSRAGMPHFRPLSTANFGGFSCPATTGLR